MSKKKKKGKFLEGYKQVRQQVNGKPVPEPKPPRVAQWKMISSNLFTTEEGGGFYMSILDNLGVGEVTVANNLDDSLVFPVITEGFSREDIIEQAKDKFEEFLKDNPDGNY